jgi:hypothetical protein
VASKQTLAIPEIFIMDFLLINYKYWFEADEERADPRAKDSGYASDIFSSDNKVVHTV